MLERTTYFLLNLKFHLLQLIRGKAYSHYHCLEGKSVVMETPYGPIRVVPAREEVHYSRSNKVDHHQGVMLMERDLPEVIRHYYPTPRFVRGTSELQITVQLSYYIGLSVRNRRRRVRTPTPKPGQESIVPADLPTPSYRDTIS